VRLSDPSSGEPVNGATDLQVVATATSGNWSDRFPATPVGDGVYEFELRVPDAGFYRMFFSAPSLGATVEDLPAANLRAS